MKQDNVYLKHIYDEISFILNKLINLTIIHFWKVKFILVLFLEV